jgi:antitoxin VapB
MVDVLEASLWPQLPAGVRGVPVTRAQREAILGYGPEGV